MSEAPRGTRFQVTHRSLRPDGDGYDFHYDCDVYGAFTESIVIRSPGVQLADDGRIAALLHGVLGASYYKCAAASEIGFAGMPDDAAAQALLAAVYGPGLGEFFVRNGLGYPPETRLTFSGTSSGQAVQSIKDAQGALIGFGGGKDSLVAMDIARHVVRAPRFFKVRGHMGPARDVPLTDDDMLVIDRFIDPKIREVNESGALNGHVPVTAMNSLIALLAAQALGVGQVVFANERSADENTMTIGAHGVNHQFSKTIEMERLIRAAVTAKGGPDYFSALRPVHEVWIARHLAARPDLHHRFMSCNRNFRIGNEAAPTWCGECPKCAFTFLLFAPFLEKARLVEIFGANLLAREALLPVFEELTGLVPVKPWECVGTVEECRACLAVIAARPEWQGDAVVASLAPRIGSDVTPLEDLLATDGPHCLPADWFKALRDADVSPQAQI